MSFIQTQSIDQLIIKLLANGPLGTSKLLELSKEARAGISKQGFYAALRRLKAEEVVILYRKIAAINTAWLAQESDRLESMRTAYTQTPESFGVLSLADKERLSYEFSSLQSLDTFWDHSQNIILHNTPAQEPEYAYDPHYWFYIARRETETRLLQEIVRQKRLFLMVVGQGTALDKAIRRDLNKDGIQYHIAPLFTNPSYYVTVIGDFVTEVFLDKDLARKVDEIYQRHTSLNPGAISELEALLNIKSRSKIRISCNKAKALALKKRLSKYFAVAKS